MSGAAIGSVLANDNKAGSAALPVRRTAQPAFVKLKAK
jgi:hypothetical protein